MNAMTISRDHLAEIIDRMGEGGDYAPYVIDDYRPWGTEVVMAVGLHSKNEIPKFFVHAALVLATEDARALAERLRQDNLGWNAVIYFSGVTVK